MLSTNEYNVEYKIQMLCILDTANSSSEDLLYSNTSALQQHQSRKKAAYIFVLSWDYGFRRCLLDICIYLALLNYFWKGLVIAMLAYLIVSKENLCEEILQWFAFQLWEISQVVKIPGFTLKAFKENDKRALFFFFIVLFCFLSCVMGRLAKKNGIFIRTWKGL